MEKSYSASYAAAGVDITAGYKAVDLMKQHVARTMNEHCIGGLGGFGGLFELDCTDMPHPVLISGTDGVGTKLRIAQYMNKHDTVGIDCVVWPKAACTLAVPWLAVSPPTCPVFTRSTSTTWLALPLALWTRARSWTTPPCSPAM